MAYFGNASRQLLESLQCVRRIHPDFRKVRVGDKDFGYHDNNKDFYQDFSENHQFYIEYAKIVNFSFVLFIYTECGNNVAWSKDALRYHLSRKYYVSKKNENS